MELFGAPLVFAATAELTAVSVVREKAQGLKSAMAAVGLRELPYALS